MSKYYIAPKEVSPGVELGVSLGLQYHVKSLREWPVYHQNSLLSVL